ncbi:hypothetical protein PV569_33480 [Streptomyces scabiei]|uniref:hypothetical protein n=1 Tax=Streptomyces scabiei TaxID=1930 RepID=UPI0029B0CF97|nr:hypothetical protein [Streptomyces scabiei]MDX3298575.1 hypothetical protein [Streptomyces scabiei]
MSTPPKTRPTGAGVPIKMALMLGRISSDDADEVMGEYAEQILGLDAHVSEYRIPCPGHRLGHLADLIVRRLEDGTRWAIVNTNLEPPTQAWTGQRYERIGDVSRHDAYRWTRGEALTLAPSLAEQETARDAAWFAAMRTEATR